VSGEQGSMASRLRGYNGGVRNVDDCPHGVRLQDLAPGLVNLPPSKSHVLRSLVLAASSRQPVSMSYEHGAGWLEAGDDIMRGVDCARALGAEVVVRGQLMEVTPREAVPSGGTLPVGEAGFLGRVVPTAAALCRSGRWRVEAAGSLRGRRSNALWSALKGAGADIAVDGGWPKEVLGPEERGDLHLLHATSSQELSAIWMALAASGGGLVRVTGEVPSAPYLKLTKDVLEVFGASIEPRDGGFYVSSVLHGPEDALDAEVDASAAAVALCAGVISGVRLEVPAALPGSAQGDWRVIEYLRDFGCVIEEEGGRLIAASGPLRGVELDLSGEPDLAPALASVAAHVALTHGESSSLMGLHTLDGKESPRGQVLCRGFSQAGLACEWRDPVLSVHPPRSAVGAQVLDSSGDHRMAFAFALLGLSLATVSVSGQDCTAKSWPNFWSSMDSGAS
jgi:3-phosphoshikimate 1-carboxyvinyltransferase